MKQTAVEWLVEQMITNGALDFSDITKAKELEKQQIIKAVYDSMGTNIDPNIGRAEQYYKESFIDGAKWQAERMYSDEEVVSILYEQFESLDYYGEDFSFSLFWEQFKKK